MTRTQKLLKNQGYSLVELLVTVTIIILLSGMSLAVYRQASLSGRDAKRKADLETVRQALVLYRTENSTYPVRTTESVASFTAMIGTLSTADYLGNTDTLQDPKGTTDPYGYRYWSDGSTFRVCAELEADGVPTADASDYCTRNP